MSLCVQLFDNNAGWWCGDKLQGSEKNLSCLDVIQVSVINKAYWKLCHC